MRAIRVLLLGVIVAALTAPPSVGGATPTRDEKKEILRTAMELEKAALDNIPLDFDKAKEQLEAAATELDKMTDRRGLGKLAGRAARFDREAIQKIDNSRADDEVTESEMESLLWSLRNARAAKMEAKQLIALFDWSSAKIERKRTRATRVSAPNCSSQEQGVSAMSSCFTLDTWKIFVDRTAKEAFCKFLDSEGRRLTNLRPLFEDVIQETACKLLDKTVVVNGVTKRVVRARLTLATLSSFDPSGTADVRVVALYR